MTFPTTEPSRMFSIIPRPPGEPDEDQARNLFSREPVPELLHHFEPLQAPAYAEQVFPATVVQEEPPLTARERFEQRQAEREARPPRNEVGFDWGADEVQPHEREWRALDLTIMFIVTAFFIIDIAVMFTGSIPLLGVVMFFNAVCVLIVAAGMWRRYDIRTQFRDLLVELRLLREDI